MTTNNRFYQAAMQILEQNGDMTTKQIWTALPAEIQATMTRSDVYNGMEMLSITGDVVRVLRHWRRMIRPRPTWTCPHCHAAGRRVECINCLRTMCSECIEPSGLCGICADQAQHARRSA